MKNQIITIIISVVLSVSISMIVFAMNNTRFGSTVTETASSDTLETFRTNVNSSLTSLQLFASTTNFVGLIATSSPLGTVGIGSGTATSSISGGRFCQYFKDETGRGMFIKLAISGSNIFSTSTTSCL